MSSYYCRPDSEPSDATEIFSVAPSAAAAVAAATSAATVSAAATPHSSARRCTAGTLVQNDANDEAIPTLVGLLPSWDGEQDLARPVSPTPSIASTINSISSVEFSVGGVPIPLQELLEEQERCEDQSEEAPLALKLDLSGCASLTDVLVCEVVCERFVHLQVLLLAQCMRLTEPAFLSIAYALPGLVELNLASCAVTDAAVEQLCARCHAITTLTLRSCRLLTDEGFASLAALPSLTSVDLSSSRNLTDGGLAAIAQGARAISVLNVAICPRVGGQQAKRWGCLLPQLTSVNLTATALDDSTATSLVANGPRPLLQSLNLSRTKVGDASVRQLLRQCPELRSIYLAGCLAVTDVSLSSLALHGRSSGLQEVHLTGCHEISDTGLRDMAYACPRLEVLVLNHCDATDAAISDIATSCTGLIQIQVVGCGGVGDASVIALAESCPQLTRADLRGCSNVTETAISAMERMLPECKLMVNGMLRNIW